MWIPKWQRDRAQGRRFADPDPGGLQRGVHSSAAKRRSRNRSRRLIGTMAEEKSKKLGMDRRAFMASSMGLATAFLAHEPGLRQLLGRRGGRDARSPAARRRNGPRASTSSSTCRAHFTNGAGAAVSATCRVHPQHGLQTQGTTGRLRLSEFRQGDVLRQRDKHDRDLRRAGQGRSTATPTARSWKARPARRASRADPAELGDGRAAAKRSTTWPAASAPCARATALPITTGIASNNAPDHTALFEQMEREVKTYKIDSWKWYCHTDPGRSGNGFKLDDEKLTYPFYEKSKKLGMKIFSVHKGYASQSRDAGPPGQPGRRREGRAGPSRPDLHHLPLGHQARTRRAAVQGRTASTIRRPAISPGTTC